MYVRELCVHYRLRRLRGREQLPDVLRTPREVADGFRRLLGDEPVEVTGLLCLSSRCHVLAYHELSRGTIDSALLHPREIFKAALLANATLIVLGHNHPSGDPTSSGDDVALTRRIRSAGDLMGI